MKATYWILGAAGILIALAILVLASPGANAWQSGDSYSGSGDWTIDNPTVVADDSITVTGNLEINSNLEIYNSQIYIDSSSDNEYYVDVSSTGSLYLWDASTLTATDSMSHYSFTDHGALDINESTVSEMWGDTNSWAGGIQIYSAGANIRNSDINNGETGGIYISGVSASITYNSIHDCGPDGASTQYCYGIYVQSDGSTSSDISYNDIYDNQYNEWSWSYWSYTYYGYGIYSTGQSSSDTITSNDIYDNGFSMWDNSQGYQLYLDGSGPTIKDNDLTDGYVGLRASGSTPPTISGGTITTFTNYNNMAGGVYATDSSLSFDSVTFTCTQYENTVAGIYVDSSSTIEVTGCTFDYRDMWENWQTVYDIYVQGTSPLTIKNCVFLNDNLYGYGVYANDHCDVSITGSTFTANYAYFYAIEAYYYCPVTVEGSSFDLEYCDWDARIIDANSYSDVTVNNTSWTMIDDSGGYDMSAIHCTDNTPGTISNLTATFDGISCSYWHGFWFDGPPLTLSDSQITDTNCNANYEYFLIDMGYDSDDLSITDTTVDVNLPSGGYQYSDSYLVQGENYGNNAEFTANGLDATMTIGNGYCYLVEWGYGSVEVDNSTWNIDITNAYYFYLIEAWYGDTYFYNDNFYIDADGLEGGYLFEEYTYNQINVFIMDNCLINLTTINSGGGKGEIDVFEELENMNAYITNSTIQTENIAGFNPIEMFYTYSTLLLDIENTTFDCDYGHGSGTSASGFQWAWFEGSMVINFTDCTINITLADEPINLDTFSFQQACGELNLISTKINWNIDASGCTAGMVTMSSDKYNPGSLGSLYLENSELTMTVSKPDSSVSLLKITPDTQIGTFKMVGSEINLDFLVASSIPTYAIQISGNDLVLQDILLNLRAPPSTSTVLVGVYVEDASPELDNITILGNGNGRISGIMATMAATPIIRDCTINNTYAGISCDFFALPSVTGTTIGNCSIGVLLLDFSNATLSSTLVMAGVGIQAQDSSWASLSSCTIQSSSHDFELDGGATIWLLDCSFNTANPALFHDDASRLIVNWLLQLKVSWQNGQVIPGAAVLLRNAQGLDYMQTQTDPDGIVPYTIVAEYVQTRAAKTSYSPYMVNVTFGGLSGEQSVIVDRTKQENITITDYANPVLAVSDPADGLIQNFKNIVVSGTASDIGSGIDMLNITYDGIHYDVIPASPVWAHAMEIPEGTWQLAVTLYDISGNSFTSTRTVTIDLTAPFIDVASPGNNTLGNSIGVDLVGTIEPGSTLTVDYRPAVVDAGGHFSYPVRLVEGRNDFVFFAMDRAGNTNSTSWTVYLDITPPTLTLTGPHDGLLTNQSGVLVSGNTEPGATVTVNGLHVAVQPDGSFSMMINLTAGTNVISVSATDMAGNTASVLRNVVLDNQIRLEITAPADKLATSQVTILVQGVTDIDALVKLNEGVVTVGSDGTFSVTYTLTEGWNTLAFSAVDRAGNTMTVTHTVLLDTIPPELEVSSPSQNAMLRTKEVVVLGICEPGISLTVNGAPVATDTGAFNTTLTLPEGDSNIHIVASDAAGNSVTIDIPLTVDLTPPSLELVEPGDGFRTLDDSVLVVGITEPGAAVTVNGIPAVVDAFGKFSVQLSLIKGKNDIKAVSTDAAGNSDTKTITVKSVSAPPAVEASTWWWTAVGLLLALGIMIPLTVYIGNSWFKARMNKEGSK